MSGERQRRSWSEYAMTLATVAAQQSQDPYVQVGVAVLRRNNTVAGLGFNGPPPGVEIDWTDRDRRRPLIVHAEQNALRHSTPEELVGGMLVSTHRPCAACTSMIASYGIRTVFYLFENDPKTYDPAELDRIAEAFSMEIRHIGG